MALGTVQAVQNVRGQLALGTLTFSTPPTNGNLILIGMGISNSGTIGTAPAGFTLLDALSNAAATTIRQEVWYKTAGAAEGTNYVFTSSISDYFNLAGYEITGQNATPFNQHSIVGTVGGGSIYTTPTVTPSVNGCLGISFFTTNDGFDIATNPYAVTTKTGWANAGSAHDQFHSIDAGNKTGLTTDTVTGIIGTWNTPINFFKAVTSIQLIAPSVATAYKPRLLSLLGVG